MSLPANLTVVGNLTADPELRYTQNGLAVCNFTIACTPRKIDRETKDWVDGDTVFVRASAWRDLAEHIAASLTKGARVLATGSLTQEGWETKEGEKRTSFGLDLDEVGASLRYSTAVLTRAARASDKVPA